MSRNAKQYNTLPGITGSFPFPTESASYRSSDYQARLSTYASRYFTDGEKREFEGMNLRFLPTEIPIVNASYMSADTKDKCMNCIRTFFVLDLAYTALAHCKKAIEYCNSNRSERATKLLTAVFHNINGYTLLNGGYANGYIEFDKVKSTFPSVTVPTGDKAVFDVPLLGGVGVGVDPRAFIFPFNLKATGNEAADDLFIHKALVNIRTPEIDPVNFSYKAILSVFNAGGPFGGNVPASGREEWAVLNMGGAALPGAMNIDGNQVPAIRGAQPNVMAPQFDNILARVRNGAYTAADIEHDTLLREVARLNKKIFQVLRTHSTVAAGPAGFITGEDVCGEGGTKAWRVVDGGVAKYIKNSEGPIDRHGQYYTDAQQVCLEAPTVPATTGPAGSIHPVRTSVAAGGAMQRSAAQKRTKRRPGTAPAAPKRKTARAARR